MPESSRVEIARLQEEYEKNPEGRLFVHLAEAYRRSGELEKARAILNQGLERHSDYLSARIVLAQVETELGATGRAAQVWREVIQLDPDNELALWALAELEYNSGDASQSLIYYRKLADLGVDDAELDEMIALLEGSAGGDAGAQRPVTRQPVAAGAATGPDGGETKSWAPPASAAPQESAARASGADRAPQQPSSQTSGQGMRGSAGGGIPGGGGSAGAGGTTPGGTSPSGGEPRQQAAASQQSVGSARPATPASAEQPAPAVSQAQSAPPPPRAETAPPAADASSSDSNAGAASSDQLRKRSRDNGSTALAHTDAIGLSDLLVRLLEYRDATFHAGSSLTRLLAISIGRELELDRIHLEALALAALLSDLGGLGLSAANGNRLSDLQDPEERRKAEQREVAVSLQLLNDITLPAGVHEAVRHQHERWDGKGYPDGLREEEIPYGARVIAIARACASYLADADDSVGIAAALEELQRNAGSRYDPVVVSVLRRVFQKRAEHGIGFGLGGRVIIVHPEELRALGVATQLHSEGYVAEVARDSGRARESVRKGSPKAVVLGASLPTEELMKFIRDLRSSTDLSAVPVIVIDANDMDLRVQLLTAGADVSFAGDVTFREFKATLDALLRRREEIERPQDRLARTEARF